MPFGCGLVVNSAPTRQPDLGPHNTIVFPVSTFPANVHSMIATQSYIQTTYKFVGSSRCLTFPVAYNRNTRFHFHVQKVFLCDCRITETEDGDDGSSEELWRRTERDRDGTERHGGSSDPSDSGGPSSSAGPSSSCGSGDLLPLEATMCAVHANSDKFL